LTTIIILIKHFFQPGVLPGECWAFKGTQGYLVIELSSPMRPTRFSVEHIPKSMSPTGTIDSAPKDFVVFGLENSDQDPNPVNLGRFTYDDNGDPIQMFESAPTDRTFKFIELNILSNHGNINYTCLYRFRVHGSR
jgi:SUN domain-containing protein 1/2